LKAVLFHKHGGPEVLEYTDFSTPEPLSGEVQVRLRAARKGGRILTVGNTGGPKFEVDNRNIFGKHLSVLGSTMDTHTDYATVMDLIFAGKLKPVLDCQYPLREAATAKGRLAAGQQMGKIALVI
jgi:NADPH:quinone reductase-like Zn-dependent oxidoreductase